MVVARKDVAVVEILIFMEPSMLRGSGFGSCFTNQVCKDFGSQFSIQTGLDS